ncbi:MAG TPA: hypothetical protein VNW94_09545 [Streptosporangiaceae bacterium]|nr:hypothetical protein [Streptosporangiaceae bacterium]
MPVQDETTPEEMPGVLVGKPTMSGARGFTIVVGTMFGIIGVLWLGAWLLSPQGPWAH